MGALRPDPIQGQMENSEFGHWQMDRRAWLSISPR